MSLLLMVVRLMWALSSSQRRLSVITRALAASAGPLAHLLLLVAGVTTLLVASAVLAFGDMVHRYSSLAYALKGKGGGSGGGGGVGVGAGQPDALPAVDGSPASGPGRPHTAGCRRLSRC